MKISFCDFDKSFSEINPILEKGEIACTDTNKFKIGDGVHAWNDLPYILMSNDIPDTMAEYIQQYSEDIQKYSLLKIKYLCYTRAKNEDVKNMKGIANTYVTKINREDTELNNLKYFFQTNVKTRKLYICFDSAEMLNKSTDIIFEYLCKKEYKNKKIYIMCEETCKLSEIMEFFAVCYTSKNKNIRFAIDGRFKFTKIKNLLK